MKNRAMIPVRMWSLLQMLPVLVGMACGTSCRDAQEEAREVALHLQLSLAAVLEDASQPAVQEEVPYLQPLQVVDLVVDQPQRAAVSLLVEPDAIPSLKPDLVVLDFLDPFLRSSQDGI